MSKFDRKLKRQQMANLPLAKFNPFERPSMFEIGGHLIKQKAKELGEQKVNEVATNAYSEGVQAGVEKATKFAIRCLENAITDTKGIGDKRREEIVNSFRNHFNNTSEFTAYLREKNVPVMKALYVADEQAENDLKALHFIRQQLQNRDLTLDSLLSIIENNPTAIDNLKLMTQNRKEESDAS